MVRFTSDKKRIILLCHIIIPFMSEESHNFCNFWISHGKTNVHIVWNACWLCSFSGTCYTFSLILAVGSTASRQFEPSEHRTWSWEGEFFRSLWQREWHSGELSRSLSWLWMGPAARATEIEYVIHSCPSGNDRCGGITIMVKAYLL